VDLREGPNLTFFDQTHAARRMSASCFLPRGLATDRYRRSRAVAVVLAKLPRPNQQQPLALGAEPRFHQFTTRPVGNWVTDINLSP
jgi:hypothetical protein